MTKSSDKANRPIESAVVEGTLVQAKRGKRVGGGSLVGFVVCSSNQWVIVHRVDPDVWILDGYVAVRIKDLKSIRDWRYRKNSDYPLQVLRHFGIDKPIRPEGLDPSTAQSVIRSALGLFELVGIQEERGDPECAWYGVPIHFGRNKLRLLNINSIGVWKKGSTSHEISEITWIEFGTRYAEALAAIGRTPPTEVVS